MAEKTAKKKAAKPSKEYVAEVLRLLDEEYGTDDIIYLEHEEPYQLLIAVILSAQCTDARVNMVTPALFREFPSVEAFANADIGKLEDAIHSTGFYHAKAKNIKACCQRLHEVYNDQVPDTMDELLTLPGVGRKTANVMLGNVFHKPSVVVDTHVGRISRKLGFTAETDPEKVEYELMKVLPEDHWILCNMHLITLGRTLCIARRPKCAECFLRGVCISAETGEKG